jgi:hypothetical protein
MNNNTQQETTSPYTDGFRSGRADWLLGTQSAYAWGCVFDYSNDYCLEYGRGYRIGWYAAQAEYRRNNAK